MQKLRRCRFSLLEYGAKNWCFLRKMRPSNADLFVQVDFIHLYFGPLQLPFLFLVWPCFAFFGGPTTNSEKPTCSEAGWDHEARTVASRRLHLESVKTVAVFHRGVAAE